MAKRAHGSGGLFERSPGRWLLSYYGQDGKRHQRNFRGNKTAAGKELRRLLQAVEENKHIAPSKLTVADHITNWLDAMDVQPLANKTKARYRELLEHYAKPDNRLGTIRLQDLTTANLKDWHATLATAGREKPKTLADGTVIRGLSPTTVRHAHRVMHLCLQSAVEARLILENPARDIRLKFDKSTPAAKARSAKDQALGTAQLKALLAGLQGSDLYLLAALLASTGLRRGEALGLAWRHIDMDAATLTVERAVEQTKPGPAFKLPKNESSMRTIALPEDVVTLLRAEWKRQAEDQLKLGRRIGDDHLLFHPALAEPERPWGPDWVSLKFLKKARKLGFSIGLHGLRHSHASQLLSAGAPATAVASRLGHASVRTTLAVYSHSVEEADKRAADTAAAIMRDMLG